MAPVSLPGDQQATTSHLLQCFPQSPTTAIPSPSPSPCLRHPRSRRRSCRRQSKRTVGCKDPSTAACTAEGSAPPLRRPPHLDEDLRHRHPAFPHPLPSTSCCPICAIATPPSRIPFLRHPAVLLARTSLTSPRRRLSAPPHRVFPEMAFLQKVGILVKRSAGTSSSLCQAVRCMSSSKLFVGGISYGMDDQSLREAFANYGQVIEARVIMDRETGRSRGFGFVTYTSTEEAAAAITGMDGKDLQGRMVRVNYAHDRGSRAGGFGGGSGVGSYGGGYGSGGYAGVSYGSGGFGGGRGSYAGIGGYAGGGRYSDGGNVGSGYNTGGNYGVYEGGRGGYGSDAGYTGGYNTAPGNYGSGSFNQEGDAPGAYGGANYGTANNNYENNASHNASVGKLDDLSDLNVDGAGGAEASSNVGDGFAEDDMKDGQDDFLQDEIKEDEETDDYASKRS